MRYIFQAWDNLARRLTQPGKIFLCADFDGTIAPIRPRPQQASLSRQGFQLLENITRHGCFSVAIISGRSLKDLRRKIGIKGIILAGNHGLEIAYNHRHFIYPPAKKFIPLIARIGRALSRRLGPFPEAVLEQKVLSLSLHYRLVKKEKLTKLKKIFLQISQPYVAGGEIKFTRGKKVWELKPPIAWDKGQAILWLKDKLRPRPALTIFIGDDLTDEGAFGAVNRIKGISIRVGKTKHSAARFYLKGTRQTQEFLTKLITSKTKNAPA